MTAVFGTRMRWLGRAVHTLLLVLGGLAAAMLAIVEWRPGWLDHVGDWQNRRFEYGQALRLVQLTSLASSEPIRARAAVRELTGELRGVRKLDRLAPLVRFVEQLRIRLALQHGDAGEAIAAAERLVALDDRDVDAAVSLGAALGHAGRHRDAIVALERVFRVVPAHAQICTQLCHQYLAIGDRAAAARALVRAGNTQPGQIWRVQWGEDDSQSTWFLLHRVSKTEVAAHFTLTDPIRGLRVRLPSLAAMVLERPVLSIVGQEGSITATLADHAPALQSLRWEGTDLVVDGDAEPILELPRLARDKPTTLTLTAGCRCVPPRWLRELVLGTAGASALATDDPSSRSSLLELRWRCLAGSRIRVRAVRDGVEPGAGIEVPLHCNTDPTSQVARFSATFEVPADATAVDLVLPAGIQATFSDLQLDGTLDTTPPRAHDLEATNGEWHASGPSPELRYTFARALRPTLCTWRGSVR